MRKLLTVLAIIIFAACGGDVSGPETNSGGLASSYDLSQLDGDQIQDGELLEVARWECHEGDGGTEHLLLGSGSVTFSDSTYTVNIQRALVWVPDGGSPDTSTVRQWQGRGSWGEGTQGIQFQSGPLNNIDNLQRENGALVSFSAGLGQQDSGHARCRFAVIKPTVWAR